MYSRRFPRLAAALTLCGLSSAAYAQESLPLCETTIKEGAFISEATLYEDEYDYVYVSIWISRQLKDGTTIVTDDPEADFISQVVNASTLKFKFNYDSNADGEWGYSPQMGQLWLPGFYTTNDQGVRLEHQVQVQSFRVKNTDYNVTTDAEHNGNFMYDYELPRDAITAMNNFWVMNEPVQVIMSLSPNSPSAYVTVDDAGWLKFSERINSSTKGLMDDYLAEKCDPEYACFFTTAAVHNIGLNDDCWELSYLRRFRDTVLQRTDAGRRAIEIYYQQAPKIVRQIERRTDAKLIWLKTYWLGVLPTAALAQLGLNGLAVKYYERLFNTLQKLAHS